MPGVDLRLRYLAAENARPSLMRGSSWFRLMTVGIMWIATLPLIRSGALWTVPLMVVATFGVLLSWAHARPYVLRRIEGRGGRFVETLTDHLLNAYGHARFDAAGVAELLGALSALTVFGVASAQSLMNPNWVALGLIGVSLYATGALFNVTTDGGLYSCDPPPPRILLAAALAAPAAAFGFALVVVLLWPSVPSIDVVLRVLIAALLLLPYPASWLVTQMLNASARTTAGTLDAERAQWRVETHTLVSNPVSLLHGELAQDEPNLEWARHYARSARAALGELPNLGSGQVDEGTFGRLVATAMRVLPVQMRTSVDCPEQDRELFIANGAYLVARTVLSDLLANAAKAGAGHIELRCRDDGELITLSVIDDGPGMAAEQAGSSLRTLVQVVERYGGDLVHSSPRSGGTCWTASWPRAVRSTQVDTRPTTIEATWSGFA